MANDTDHRLVSELMDVVQQRDGVRVAAQQSGPAPGGRRILDIVLWSSITNVTLLACFLVGWTLARGFARREWEHRSRRLWQHR